MKRRNFFKTISLLPFIKGEITNPVKLVPDEIIPTCSGISFVTASRMDCPELCTQIENIWDKKRKTR